MLPSAVGTECARGIGGQRVQTPETLRAVSFDLGPKPLCSSTNNPGVLRKEAQNANFRAAGPKPGLRRAAARRLAPDILQKRRFRQRCPGQKRVWNLTGVPRPHLQSRAVTMALLWPEDWQSKDGTLHSSSRCPITAKLEFHQWASEPRGPQSPCPTPSSSRNPYPC